MKRYLSLCHEWWSLHPALLYGVAMLLGYSAALVGRWDFLIPAIALLLPLVLAPFYAMYALAARLLFAMAVAFLAYFHGAMLVPLPIIPEEGMRGEAAIEIYSASRHEHTHGTYWRFQALLSRFSDTPLNDIPITIILATPQETLPFDLAQKWYLHGKLKKKDENYYFTVDKKAPRKAAGFSWRGALANLRLITQNTLWNYLNSHLSSVRAAPFLFGLLTGLFDDASLRYHFSRFGIQHLLVISGFHFSLVAASLGFFLRLFLPYRMALISLLPLLFLYFLLLDLSPSTLRAWLTVSLALVGAIIGRRSRPLNLMGMALIMALALEPRYLIQAGFQLSFGITAAILLFTHAADRALIFLFLSRPLSSVIEWDNASQHLYVGACIVRQALALNFAVNLVAFPLSLYHFHVCSLIGLLYNLFFPLLVTFSVIFCLIGAFLHFSLPPLGLACHAINSIYTHYLIGLACDAPPILDRNLYASPPEELLSLYFTLLACFGAFLHLNQRQAIHNNVSMPF